MRVIVYFLLIDTDSVQARFEIHINSTCGPRGGRIHQFKIARILQKMFAGIKFPALDIRFYNIVIGWVAYDNAAEIDAFGSARNFNIALRTVACRE